MVYLTALLVNFETCLFSVLQNIADSRPKVRYIVAVDDSKTKLRSIVKVIYIHFRAWWLSFCRLFCDLNNPRN